MNGDMMSLLLRWVTPPALGAVIGYVTNAIAIRMLFRPLTEKRLLGIRLPLTPGVIPRQRYALAESIGRMVSEHLITEQTVRAHVEAPAFREGLGSTIASLTERALATSPASLSGSAREFWQAALGPAVRGILARFLRSAGFFAAVRSVVARLVAAVGEQRLGKVLRPEALKALVRSRIALPVAEGAASRWVRDRVETWAAGHCERKTPLGRLVPAGAGEGAMELLRAAFPRLREALLAWLRGPAVRRELEVQGRLFLRDTLDRLSSLQRLFVSVAQYDRSLDESMPDIVDDALRRLEAFLSSPTSFDRLEATLRSSLSKLAEKHLGELGEELGVDLPAKLGRVAERLAAGIDAQRLTSSLEKAIDEFFEANSDRTLREVAGRWFGMQEHEVAEKLSNAALGYLTREQTLEGFVETLEGFLDRLLEEERPLGELLAVSPGQKRRLDEFLCERAEALVAARLPQLVEGFNIRQMVVDRINRLDVAEVEALLMIVIAKHLKWINIFGALLGALIGLVQSVLSALA